jgi:hypothetical protein
MALEPAINAWMAGRRFDIIDIGFKRFTKLRENDSAILRFVYKEYPGAVANHTGEPYVAKFFQTTSVNFGLEEFVGLTFTAPIGGIYYALNRIVDVSERNAANGAQRTYMALGVDASSDWSLYFFGQQNAVFMANPVAPIAPRAQGDCNIFNGIGLPIAAASVMPVRNLADSHAWPNGQVSAVFIDELTGEWCAIPTCCV